MFGSPAQLSGGSSRLGRRKGRGAVSGAFTLIEIMIVVAIMGLTFTIGLPSFVKVFKREGMRKAEKDLLDACREARADAIMNNRTVNVVFHPLDRSLEVPGAFKLAQFPEDVTIDILGVNFIQLENAEEARIRFYPNGTSDEFTIILRSVAGEMREYSLDIVTALTVVKIIR
jgi:prepilin-type N-terminal cleavage/methylation domain-containing protein